MKDQDDGEQADLFGMKPDNPEATAPAVADTFEDDPHNPFDGSVDMSAIKHIVEPEDPFEIALKEMTPRDEAQVPPGTYDDEEYP